MRKQNELGLHLRKTRKRNSLSLRAVERETGISNAYLSQLESGKIQQPSPQILHKLSRLYGASYRYVMELAGYPLPDASEANEGFARFASRIGPTTEDEEDELIEYLQFIRSRRRQQSE